MAVVSIEFEVSNQNQASRQILDLRDRILEVDKANVRLRQSLAGATAEQQKSIRSEIQANNVKKAVLRSLVQEQTLRKSRSAQLVRETRQVEIAARKEETALRRVQRARDDAFLGIQVVAQQVSRAFNRITGSLVTSAAQFETYRTSINAIAGSAEAGSARFEQLLNLTTELVGIDTGPLLSFANRLDAIGLSAEQTDGVIRGVVNSQGELGKTGAVNVRILTQVSQALSSNRIQGQDLLPILREMPRFWQQASEALGVNVSSLEELRTAAVNFGGPASALIRIFQHIGRTSRGIDLDTFNAQLEIFRDLSGIVSAELGNHLLPVLTGFLKAINFLLERFRELPNTVQGIVTWSSAITSALTTIIALAASARFGLRFLQEGINQLHRSSRFFAFVNNTLIRSRSIIRGLTAVVNGFGRGLSALPVTAVITLAVTWLDIFENITAARNAGDGFLGTASFANIQKFNVATSQTATALGLTQEALKRISDESATTGLRVERLAERIDQARQELIRLINASGEREQIVALRNEIRQLNQELNRLTGDTIADVAQGAVPLAVQLVRATDAAIRFEGAFSRALSPPEDDGLTSDQRITNIQRTFGDVGRAITREHILQLRDEELTQAERVELILRYRRERADLERRARTAIAAERRRESEAQKRQEEQANEELLDVFESSLTRRAEAYAAYIQELQDLDRVRQQQQVDVARFEFQTAIRTGDTEQIQAAERDLITQLNRLQTFELNQIGITQSRKEQIIGDTELSIRRIQQESQNAQTQIQREAEQDRLDALDEYNNQVERALRDASREAVRLRQERERAETREAELGLQNRRALSDLGFRSELATQDRQRISIATEEQIENIYAIAEEQINRATTAEERRAISIRATNDAINARETGDRAIGRLDEDLERDLQRQLDRYTGVVEQEERIFEESLNRRREAYRQYSELLVQLGEDFLRGENESLGEYLNQFLIVSARIIAQAVIDAAIQQQIDNRLTEAKIRNLRKIEAERQRLISSAPEGVIPDLEIPASLLARSGLTSGDFASFLIPELRLLEPLAQIISSLFHFERNDRAARRAGRNIGTGLIGDIISNPRPAGIQSANDVISEITGGINDGLSQIQQGAAQGLPTELIVNLNLGDGFVEKFTIRQDQMRVDNTV